MIEPSSAGSRNTAPTVVLDASVKNQVTSEWWAHKDYVQVQKPWAEEDHIPPPRGEMKLGDVESWVDYVNTYCSAPDFPPLLTWNASGLHAILDYHHSEAEPGRCQWRAEYPFVLSLEWLAWRRIASGSAISHEDAIDALEDRAEDIVSPTSGDLMNLLRHLKATVKKNIEVNRREDGAIFMSVVGEQGIKAGTGTADLPTIFKIGIPVLKGLPDKFELTVRVRYSPNDGHLTLRMSMPNAEATLERVYAERVDAAKALLGNLKLLRAAD